MDKKFSHSTSPNQPSWLSWQWRMQVSPLPDVPTTGADVVPASSGLVLNSDKQSD